MRGASVKTELLLIHAIFPFALLFNLSEARACVAAGFLSDSVGLFRSP